MHTDSRIQQGHALLLLILVCGCSSTPPLSQTEALAAERVRELGGTVSATPDGDYSTVIKVDLKRSSAKDADLQLLANLPNTRVLYLARTEVSDEGMKHVAQLSNLKELHLGRTAVTDQGLLHLRQLTQLEWIATNHTSITKSGLGRLKKTLPKMRTVR